MVPWTYLLVILLSFLAALLIYQRIKYQEIKKEEQNVLTATRRIFSVILEDLEFESVAQKIADTIPNELKFATGVLAILDESKGVIRRIAASKTPEAQNAIQALRVPFNQIEISVNDPNNLMAKALRENKVFVTDDAYEVLGPVLTQEEAKNIQRIMSTKTTFVYPIFIKTKPIGVFLASTSKNYNELNSTELEILNSYVVLAGLVIQNSSLFTSLKDTSKKLAEASQYLSEANDKLKELDKLKDDFVSVASHELRTPMTAIRSYAWMALYKSDVPLSEKLKKYLSRTLTSTERLIYLVNDMLNISRIESGRIEVLPQIFDIQALTIDVLVEVEPKEKEKNLQIEMKTEKLPKVFADPDKVRQVLLNLIGNALKFTPPGGKIKINFFTDGQFVDISIADSGVGIGEEDLPRLFKKFGRLDNTYVAAATTGGTGLGLFISKSLVELMRGKIWAKSAGVGKGATFSFSLPIANNQVLNQAEKYTKKAEGEAKNLEPVAI